MAGFRRIAVERMEISMVALVGEQKWRRHTNGPAVLVDRDEMVVEVAYGPW